MAKVDEEKYLDSLLESLGDVEDIVTSEEMGVEKILDNEPDMEAFSSEELGALLGTENITDLTEEAEDAEEVAETVDEKAAPSDVEANSGSDAVTEMMEADMADSASKAVVEAAEVAEDAVDTVDAADMEAGLGIDTTNVASSSENDAVEADVETAAPMEDTASAEKEAINEAAADIDDTGLSESDLKRLEQMNLDNIIEQAKLDAVSDKELFGESDDAADGADGAAEGDGAGAGDKVEGGEGAAESTGLGAEGTGVGATEDATAAGVEAVASTAKNATELDSDEDEEGSGKKKKKKGKGGGLLAALKSIFIEDDDIAEAVNETSTEDDGKAKKASKAEPGAQNPDDENQKLINEVFGDKDTLDENLAPKKGFIAKLKYRLEQFKKKNEEEEKLEEEAEKIEAEKKAKQKEENKAAKAAKKEEAKKAKAAKPKKEKKPKPEKPKKEKKPKPEPKPEDILKIKPVSLIMFVLFIAGVCVLVAMGSSLLTSNSVSADARGQYESGNFDKAYAKLSGTDINKADESIYEKSSVVMYVQRQYESYSNYLNLKMYTEALNALVKGLDRYDTYYNQAKELGVEAELDEQKQLIYAAFKSTYNMSQTEADKLQSESHDDFTTYYVKIDKIGKAMQ